MQEYSDEPIDFSEQNVICNLLIENPKNVKNFICLLTKQYIYRQKCLGKSLSFMELRNHIKTIEIYEKYNAIRSNQLYKHEKKWHAKLAENSRTKTLVHMQNDFLLEYIQNM